MFNLSQAKRITSHTSKPNSTQSSMRADVCARHARSRGGGRPARAGIQRGGGGGAKRCGVQNENPEPGEGKSNALLMTIIIYTIQPYVHEHAYIHLGMRVHIYLHNIHSHTHAQNIAQGLANSPVRSLLSTFCSWSWKERMAFGKLLQLIFPSYNFTLS